MKSEQIIIVFGVVIIFFHWITKIIDYIKNKIK